MRVMRKPLPFLSQLMNVFLMELTNWRWSWRGTLLTSLIAPILSIIALGSLVSGNVETLTYVFTGNLVMSLMFSNLNNVASRFTYMRFGGTLDYYATLPIRKSALMVAVVLSFFLLSLPSLLMTIGFSIVFLKLPLAFNPIVLLVIPLCVLPLAAIGAIIGTNARTPDESGSLSLLTTMLLLFIGPVLIPPYRLPELAIALGYFSPATYAASALRQTLVQPVTSIPMIDLAALIGFSLVSFWFVGLKLDWRQR